MVCQITLSCHLHNSCDVGKANLVQQQPESVPSHTTSEQISLYAHYSTLPARQAVTEGGADAACHGLVPQAHFLHSLGIAARLETLQRVAAPADAAALRAGYERCELGLRLGFSGRVREVLRSEAAV